MSNRGNAMSDGKYIFLDIDGVLNTGRNDYLEPERFGHHFDNEAVMNLRKIIDETNAAIVISSSWKHMGEKRILEIWDDWNLPGKVIGCTPGGWGDNKTRGEEIQAWIDVNSKETCPYVIIDDMEAEIAIKGQFLHWVQVVPHCGITAEDAEIAIRILGSTDEGVLRDIHRHSHMYMERNDISNEATD